MTVLGLCKKEPLLFRLITEILMEKIIGCLGIVSKYCSSGRNGCGCGWARVSHGFKLGW